MMMCSEMCGPAASGVKPYRHDGLVIESPADPTSQNQLFEKLPKQFKLHAMELGQGKVLEGQMVWKVLEAATPLITVLPYMPSAPAAPFQQACPQQRLIADIASLSSVQRAEQESLGSSLVSIPQGAAQGSLFQAPPLQSQTPLNRPRFHSLRANAHKPDEMAIQIAQGCKMELVMDVGIAAPLKLRVAKYTYMYMHIHTDFNTWSYNCTLL